MEARTGDREKLNRLVRAELPRLYRIALRFTGSRSEAEDLVSQTLLQAVRGWDGFDGRYPVAWLVKIMTHTLAKTRSMVATLPLQDAEAVPESRSVEDEVMIRTSLDAILKALDELSEEHKMVITLCDIEQLSYAEVSEALDIPAGTIASRLFRARKALEGRCRGVWE